MYFFVLRSPRLSGTGGSWGQKCFFFLAGKNEYISRLQFFSSHLDLKCMCPENNSQRIQKEMLRPASRLSLTIYTKNSVTSHTSSKGVLCGIRLGETPEGRISAGCYGFNANVLFTFFNQSKISQLLPFMFRAFM